MDWEFLLRYGGRYTVLFGGGTVAVASLLPRPVAPYALLASVAVGVLLFGRAALAGGGGGPTTGGDAISSGLGLAASGNNRIFDARDDDAPAGAGSVFYALGLVVFGVVAIATLL